MVLKILIAREPRCFATLVTQTVLVVVLAGQPLANGQGSDAGADHSGTGLLRLRHGQMVAGRFVAHTPQTTQHIHWHHPAFARPLQFAADTILGASFPQTHPIPAADGQFGFQCADGSLVYGDLVELDDQQMVVRNSVLGRLTLPRSVVIHLFRWRDGRDRIYHGPGSLSTWNSKDLTVWSESAGGVVTNVPGASLVADLGLPDQAIVDLRIGWSGTPNFRIELAVPPDIDQAAAEGKQGCFRLEVWDDQLVLMHESESEAQITSLGSINSAAGSLVVSVLLDQKLRIVRAQMLGGQQSASLQIPTDGQLQPNRGLAFHCVRGTARLESLQVRPCDPSLLAPQRTTPQTFWLTDDQRLEGQLLSYSEQTRTLQIETLEETLQVPLAQVQSIVSDAPTADQPRAETAKRAIYLSTQDGMRLQGEFGGVHRETIQLTWTSSGDELAVPINDIRSVDFAAWPVAESSEQDDVEVALLAPQAFLLGRLLDATATRQDSCFLFVPNGGASGSVLRLDAKAELLFDLEAVDQLIDAPQSIMAGRSDTPLGPRNQPAQDRPDQVALQVDGNAVVAEQKPLPRIAGAQAGIRMGGMGGMGAGDASFPTDSQHSGGFPQLHLRSGDTVDCELLAIDATGVLVRLSDDQHVQIPHARIRAVELRGVQRGGVPSRDGQMHNGQREDDRQGARDPMQFVGSTRRADSQGPSEREVDARLLRLLTVPRMRRDNPPRHLLRSVNGDWLRGDIVRFDPTVIVVQSRLEQQPIATEVVSQIIWLHEDETLKPDGTRQEIDRGPRDGETAGPSAAPSDQMGLIQVVRQDGRRLSFRAERLQATTLFGTNEIFGACSQDLTKVNRILVGMRIADDATELPFANFRLQHAVDPLAFRKENPTVSSGPNAGLIGQPAPNFELDLLDGQRYRLQDQRGSVVVLDFWASWCGPCMQTMPEVDRIVGQYGAQDIQLLAINLQESAEKIQQALQRLKLTTTIALDRAGVVAERYGATAIPQTVVIDRQGNVTHLFIGGGQRTLQQLEAAIESVINPQSSAGD